MNLLQAVSAIGVAAGLALVAALAWSLLYPERRLWPPPQGRIDWRTRVIWSLSLLPFAAGLAAAALDPRAPVPEFAGQRPLGIALLVAGAALLLWGLRTLSLAQAMGRAVRLVTHGPYRFTRNPQYVGDILLVIGFSLHTGSSLVGLIALPLVAALVLFPFTEEPWLADRFGSAYERYREQVPRFLGPVHPDLAARGDG